MRISLRHLSGTVILIGLMVAPMAQLSNAAVPKTDSTIPAFDRASSLSAIADTTLFDGSPSSALPPQPGPAIPPDCPPAPPRGAENAIEVPQPAGCGENAEATRVRALVQADAQALEKAQTQQQLARLAVDASPADPSAPPEGIQAVSAPDSFGYTWNNGVPYNWIDASAGQDLGLAGDDIASAPLAIGFSFPFYENTYSTVSVSTNGLITFGGPNSSFANHYLPNVTSPNNLIAPFWRDLILGAPYNDGKVYLLQGGSAPNRYLVIEWFHATACCSVGGTDYKTFEAILHESGDIVFQYQALTGTDLAASTVGIENSSGQDGLTYLYRSVGLTNGSAVRFVRPTPRARLAVNQPQQGAFSNPGGGVSFEVGLRNSGDLGADRFDLIPSSQATWPVQLLGPDGATPLTDTDGDGTIDTGLLQQGQSLTVTVRVTTSPAAVEGNTNMATVLVRSSQEPARTWSLPFRTAVPAPFVQAYADWADARFGILLEQAGSQEVKALPDSSTASAVSVAEMPSRDFLYVWQNGGSLAYAIFDDIGTIVRPMAGLLQNASAFDQSPALAVAPNGRVAIIWTRVLSSGSQSNYNVMLALLDASGSLLIGPLSLTNNAAYGDFGALNVPRMYSPRVTATRDNRFVVAWQHYMPVGPTGACSSTCALNDIYYTVLDTGASTVYPATNLTSSTLASLPEAYMRPALTPVSTDRALLAYTAADGNILVRNLWSNGSADPMSWATVDGNTTPNDRPSLVELTGGRVLMASARADGVRFTTLAPSGNAWFVQAYTVTSTWIPGYGFVSPSVTADQSDRAIVTWSENHTLVYTLVSAWTELLTPPMEFYHGRLPDYPVYTSSETYGNTTYSPAARFSVTRPDAPWVRADGPTDLTLTVRNLGSLGADVFELGTDQASISGLLAADGVTPLVDNNGNGMIDTGSLPMGASVDIRVRVQPPPGAGPGWQSASTWTIGSTREPARTEPFIWPVTIPSTFAQVYRDDVDTAVHLYTVRSMEQRETVVTDPSRYPYSPAVASLANGFAAFWTHYRNSGAVNLAEIEYTILDQSGASSRAIGPLNDLSGAAMTTYEESAAVAVSPNGRMAVVWKRMLYDHTSNQYNYNLYLRILNAAGDPLGPPVNVTNNTVWGTANASNVPNYYHPVIAATADNRFEMAWVRWQPVVNGEVNDVFFASSDANGLTTAPVKLTNAVAATGPNFVKPILTSLSGNRVLVTWSRRLDSQDRTQYIVLSSQGIVVRATADMALDATCEPVNWWNNDSMQFPDGRILIAWEAWGCHPNEWLPRIRYAVLSSTYEPLGVPQWLGSGSSTTGDTLTSLALDGDGHAIASFVAQDSTRLYYAQIASDGTVLAGPISYKVSQAVRPYLAVHDSGYHLTEYRPATNLAVQAPAEPAPIAYGKPANLTFTVTNQGSSTATGVVVTDTLPAGWTVQSVAASQGSCVTSGGQAVCALGTLSNGATGQVTVVVLSPTINVGTAMLTVTGREVDPDPTNNHVTQTLRSQAFPLFVPGVIKSYVPTIQGNGTPGTAYGPVVANFDYYAYPITNDAYFFLDLPRAGTIQITLSNPSGQGTQLLLYENSPIAANFRAQAAHAPFTITYTAANPGRYYARVYTASGLNNTKYYTLRFTYP